MTTPSSIFLLENTAENREKKEDDSDIHNTPNPHNLEQPPTTISISRGCEGAVQMGLGRHTTTTMVVLGEM